MDGEGKEEWGRARKDGKGQGGRVRAGRRRGREEQEG